MANGAAEKFHRGAVVVPPGTLAWRVGFTVHASREGKVLARNIAAEIRGGRKRPFAFKTLGQLAAIGRRPGVANIMGLNFSGFLAWWMVHDLSDEAAAPGA